MTNNMSYSLDSAKAYIASLDLRYLIEMMCAKDYPLPRWNMADAEHCVQLYKNFLYLQKKYHDIPLVPTREIDECWHNHILHTKQYFHDCEQIFGHYLHHTPASKEDESTQLVDAYLKTKELYFAEFGEVYGIIQKVK